MALGMSLSNDMEGTGFEDMNGIMILEENIDSLRKLSTEDLGTLIRALLDTAVGAEPDKNSFSFVVELLYPIMQASVDRIRKVSEMKAEAGRAGGKANRKQTESTALSTASSTDESTDSSPYHTIPNHTIPENIKGRFTPPTIEDVEAYAEEKGITLDAERFVDYYASKGWKVGTTPMKDWRAAARNWAARDAKEKPKPAPVFNFEQRKVDYDKMLDETIGW